MMIIRIKHITLILIGDARRRAGLRMIVENNMITTIYIYIYVYTHYACVYIYIYIYRERERVCKLSRLSQVMPAAVQGFEENAMVYFVAPAYYSQRGQRGYDAYLYSP